MKVGSLTSGNRKGVRNMFKKIIGTTVGLGTLALVVTMVLAAAGDSLGTIDPLGPGECDNGIGVAFDGSFIWYTCAGETKIRKTDLAGANLGFIDTAEGLNPISVDAIAWDSDLNKIWGGELVDTDADGANDTCRIYTIDPTNGAATTAFDRTDTGCNFLFFDGLAVDNVTDTLYYSPDVQKYIRHLNKDGTLAANDPIDFETITSSPDRCPAHEPIGSNDLNVAGCPSSGLAMGIDGTLFAGTNGAGRIVTLNPIAKTFLSDFASVTGRDEDLECGPLVEGKETVLSRDYETGRIDVLEAPVGTCQLPTLELDPISATNGVGEDHSVTATVLQGANPVVGTLVSFEVTSGPNIGQISDPNTGECAVNDDCTTDGSGRVTWTYTSNGSLGTDIIVACFTDVTGAEQCSRATKAWVDLTPPETACTETTNPHGQTVPPAGSTTLPGPKGGQNEDGFYELLAEDLIDPDVAVFVVDLGSGTVFGPFAPGTKIKYTQAPGSTPSSSQMGSSNGQAGAIAWHIIGTGDAAMYAVDESGNQSANVSCLVPPPPK